MLPQTLTEHQITCASKLAMIIWHLCYEKIPFTVTFPKIAKNKNSYRKNVQKQNK